MRATLRHPGARRRFDLEGSGVGSHPWRAWNDDAGALTLPVATRPPRHSHQAAGPNRPSRQLILPVIFPTYVTGGITAAGGA